MHIHRVLKPFTPSEEINQSNCGVPMSQNEIGPVFKEYPRAKCKKCIVEEFKAIKKGTFTVRPDEFKTLQKSYKKLLFNKDFKKVVEE